MADRLGAAIGALTLAWCFLTFFAGYRSEDLMLLTSTATVVFSWSAITNRSRPGAFIVLAGLCSGLGIVAKPGGAAAFLAGLSLQFLAAPDRRLRRSMIYLGSAAVIPLGVLVWLYQARAVAAAWESVAVYGRYYFPPLTMKVVKTLVYVHLNETLCIALASVHLALLGASRLWRDRVLSGIQDQRFRWRAFRILFVGWPLLELVCVLPQTTMFWYVLFNFLACLVFLAVLAFGSLLTRPTKSTPHAPRADLGHRLRLISARGACGVHLSASSILAPASREVEAVDSTGLGPHRSQFRYMGLASLIVGLAYLLWVRPQHGVIAIPFALAGAAIFLAARPVRHRPCLTLAAAVCLAGAVFLRLLPHSNCGRLP